MKNRCFEPSAASERLLREAELLGLSADELINECLVTELDEIIISRADAVLDAFNSKRKDQCVSHD